MRITLDARMMGPESTRGIGRYIQELVRAMTTVAPEHRYVLLVRNPESSPFQGNSSVEHVTADIPWYGIQEQISMPRLMAQTRADLVHVPHWNVPVLSNVPRVVTIHDLILLHEPASAKSSTRGFVTRTIRQAGYRAVLSQAVTHSCRLLVPTEWVAQDLKRFFPSLTTPIDVTGEGMPTIDAARWMDADPADPYLLYVGSAYPHKNLDVLIDAWKQAAIQHPALSLVIVGEKDAFMQQLMDRVTREQLPRVRFPGKVTDEALVSLYRAATAFVFPSRQEGFGLPPLEALAYGCPVIAARASCLPEVLGEQGVMFFQPSDTNDILRAIATVLRDPVSARAQARAAAPILGKKHQWEQAAERTIQAYTAAVR